MHEVEVKVRVEDAEALRARMHALGARLPPPRPQTDLFFAHPARDFSATDEALRLRDEGGLLELTYKGPKLAKAGTKARVEENVPVGTDPTALLQHLGFVRSAVLHKKRATARVGPCEVSLDHVEGLGWFCEVEALREDAARGAAEVHSVLVRLGLQDAPRITKSYLELALAAGARGVRSLDADADA
jgi:adenylate cyclase, class 2